MEGGTFHTKDVARLLRERYVESRVHMDQPDKIPPDRYAVHELLQKELVASIAMPLFAILDPDTGEFLARHRLRGGPGQGWADDFKALLEKPEPKPRPH